MVDCFDRIHLQLNEVILRPLKELHEQAALTSVTLRPPGRGPRILVTVNKTLIEGSEESPVYSWSVHAVSPSADLASDGLLQADETLHATPEAAYWAAIDAVAAARRFALPSIA